MPGFSQDTLIGTSNISDLELRIGPVQLALSEVEGMKSGQLNFLKEYHLGSAMELAFSRINSRYRVLRYRLGFQYTNLSVVQISDSIVNYENTENIVQAFAGVGIGGCYSKRKVSVRLGTEGFLGWQFGGRAEVFERYINSFGEERSKSKTVSNPGILLAGLQVFSGLHIELKRRIYLGIEIRQPITMAITRGNQEVIQMEFDQHKNLLERIEWVRLVREIQILTPEFMLPLIGIRYIL